MNELVELKKICNISSGGTPSRKHNEFYNGNIKWAKISDLETAGDGFIYDTEEKITKAGLENIRNRIFEKDTLFLAMYGSVGKTAITKTSMSCNQAILGITTKNKNNLDLAFLKYWFDSIKEKLLDSAKGVALKNLSAGMVKDLKIPLPPLPEQQRIAGILDAAAALRDKTQALLHQYDLLAQSLFLEMFGDTYINPKKFPVMLIEELADDKKHSIKAGPFGSSLKKEFYVESGYKIYGQEQVIKDDLSFGDYYIDEDRFQKLKSCKVFEGDVLISLVGTYGKISVVPNKFEPGIINPRLMKISPNQSIVRPDFLKRILQSEGVAFQLKNKSRGGTMDIINVGIIRKVKTAVPPIALQNEFAEKISLIEQQKALAKQELQQSEDLFNGLLQKAFKGEV